MKITAEDIKKYATEEEKKLLKEQPFGDPVSPESNIKNLFAKVQDLELRVIKLEGGRL